MPAGSGRYPSGQRGQTVNLLAYAFGGSNPPLPTIVSGATCSDFTVGGLREARGACAGRPPLTAGGLRQEQPRRVAPADCSTSAATGGNSSAVERQPSKLGVAGSNPVSRSILAGAARQVPTAGGLRQARPGCVVTGAARPDPTADGLRQARPGCVVTGAARPAPTAGGLRQARPGCVVAVPAVDGLSKARRGCVVSTPVPTRGAHTAARPGCVDQFAHVAQSAERVLGKDEVSGSIPDMGSSFRYVIVTTVNGRC
jgi:hypothetical protein